jgi:hypothetical protein
MAGMGTGMGGVTMGMNSMVLGTGMAIPGTTMSGMTVNSMGAMNGMGNSGGVNMAMPGYAQTLQGMGNKAVLMKDKQANLVQQQQLLQQQLLQQQQQYEGYDHDQDHTQERETGHDHDLAEASSMSQPLPTQAQLLRQSLNGMNTAHVHAPQPSVSTAADSSSFDSGFPALGSRSSGTNLLSS